MDTQKKMNDVNSNNLAPPGAMDNFNMKLPAVPTPTFSDDVSLDKGRQCRL